ncbi:sugar phosphate isomerase/epimerase family protein [Gulosibacter chungangensis]|uniref:TIM barrel protein n=1 Tax=Gulosibacter chungangensis TaxID=979746 RepID=A0A7J5BFN0_9MICO|nr:sugar phosphate isomerase/epimerase [Gulosibacter chungangensis]KAB1645081.1 TIM barrel protein [Gulosibacter chungangensis]
MTNGIEATDSAPRVGIAPDSWGVWNAVDEAQPAPEQYLREVAEAGFHWTELGPFGYLGTDAAKLREDFAKYDLALSAGTVFVNLHRGASEIDKAWADVREVATLVQALGAEHIITIPGLWERGEDGHVVGDRAFNAEEWDAFFAGHNEIGRRLLEEFGMRQQFHSHAESPIGSYREVVRLLEGTDERYVNLCLDTGHLAYYYGDNERLIREFPNRIGYLHLKQVEPDLLADVLKNDISFVDAVKQGVMIEPPLGVPDYNPILREAAIANPGIFAIVEQDMYPLADFAQPLEIARRTHEYIAGCGAPVRFRETATAK